MTFENVDRHAACGVDEQPLWTLAAQCGGHTANGIVLDGNDIEVGIATDGCGVDGIVAA